MNENTYEVIIDNEGDERYKTFNIKKYQEAVEYASYIAFKWNIRMQCKLSHGRWEVGQSDNGTPTVGN